ALDQTRLCRRPGRVRAVRGEEVAGVLAPLTALRGGPQQGCHRWALVEEDADIALRFGKRHRSFQRGQRTRDVASRLTNERLQHGDLDDAARAMCVFCGGEEALQQSRGVIARTL